MREEWPTPKKNKIRRVSMPKPPSKVDHTRELKKRLKLTMAERKNTLRAKIEHHVNNYPQTPGGLLLNGSSAEKNVTNSRMNSPNTSLNSNTTPFICGSSGKQIQIISFSPQNFFRKDVRSGSASGNKGSKPGSGNSLNSSVSTFHHKSSPSPYRGVYEKLLKENPSESKLRSNYNTLDKFLRDSSKKSNAFLKGSIRDEIDGVIGDQMSFHTLKIENLISRKIMAEVPKEMMNYMEILRIELDGILNKKISFMNKSIKGFIEDKLKFLGCLSQEDCLDDDEHWMIFPEKEWLKEEGVEKEVLNSIRSEEGGNNVIIESDSINNSNMAKEYEERVNEWLRQSKTETKISQETSPNHGQIKKELISHLANELEKTTKSVLIFSQKKISEQIQIESNAIKRKMEIGLTKSFLKIEEDIKNKIGNVFQNKFGSSIICPVNNVESGSLTLSGGTGVQTPIRVGIFENRRQQTPEESRKEAFEGEPQPQMSKKGGVLPKGYVSPSPSQYGKSGKLFLNKKTSGMEQINRSSKRFDDPELNAIMLNPSRSEFIKINND